MTVPPYPHKSYLQIGKETTYGTPVAATIKLELISESLKLIRKNIDDPSIDGNMSIRQPYEGPRWVAGTFTVRANFEGVLEIFRGVFGGYTNTLFDTPARDHVFKESLAAPTLPSYTLQVVRGDVTTGTCWRYAGCKFVGLNIKGAAGTGAEAIVVMEVTVVGQDAASGVTVTPALNFPATLPVKFDLATTFADDGTTDAMSATRIRAFEFDYQRPHTVEERLYLGSLLIDEPVMKAKIACMWKIQEEFFTRTAFDAYKAGTLGSPRLIFTVGNVLATHSSLTVTVNAGTTITRGSGSFVADGWQVGDLVTSSAFVPSGTYVTAVAALTLTVDQVCSSSGGTTNITGGASRELEIRSNQATLDDDPAPPIRGLDSLIASLSWKANFDATDAACAVIRSRGQEAALP